MSCVVKFCLVFLIFGLGMVFAPAAATAVAADGGDFASQWTLVTASAGWTTRTYHTSAVLPDGSIVLMGGSIHGSQENDTWRSTDGGATWTLMNASGGWEKRTGLASVAEADGGIVLMGGWVATGRNDTWRSTDHGTTWTLMNASSGWSPRLGHTSVAMADGTIVLMGGYDGARRNDTWRSTDHGATWTLVNASSGWSPRNGHTSVAMADGIIVLMGGYRPVTTNDTWRSIDGGATWTRMNASSGWPARADHASVALPDGSIVLMGGSPSYDVYRNDTWRSTDNGATWTLVNASPGWSARLEHTSVAMPDGSIVLIGGYGDAGNSGDVWSTGLVTVTSPNGGQKWKRGTVHTIRWTYNGYSGPFVDVTLLKGATINRVIRRDVLPGSDGIGSLKWKVPFRMARGKSYSIRIETRSGFVDGSDGPFMIR